MTAAARVKVGIETDRGPWVAALVAAGYEVFAINPMSVSRYRDDHIVARNQAYNGRSMSRFADPRGGSWASSTRKDYSRRATVNRMML